jgi:aminopeptidase-like protein
MMRSKYGRYPEYHTSLDNLTLVTPAGLAGGYEALRLALEVFETNAVPRVTVLCEPQLGKRGLYPTLSTKGSAEEVRTMMDLIAYSDGCRSMLEIAELIDAPMWKLTAIAQTLEGAGLLTFESSATLTA